MAEAILIEGQRAWLKYYGEGSRAFALGLLNLVAHRFGMDALRPPPHRGGEQARDIEARRLAELREQGVNVPAVIGEGRAALLLEHTGDSFNQCMRDADDAGRDRLVKAAMATLADAHARGAYLGQPLPRNMTWDGENVGFLDFEEDPLEVMDLPTAQARDWLMFGYDVAKYYDHRGEVLQDLLIEAMERAQGPVVEQANEVTTRLQSLARLLKRAGRSGRVLAQAIFALHAATSLGLVLLTVVCVDWLIDGQVDLLGMLG